MWYPVLQNGTVGRMIDFRHFDSFDPTSGWDGATLEWSPKYGTLKPVNMKDKIKPICGAPKFTCKAKHPDLKCICH